ncbi:MAG: pantoate--beta-alanine ligase, partial [Candidatus Eremiobacteraeota bacterium]|nr:pantoate--beta-alanine ligase [Candidatus Eremiobacteraeota bacterium]
LSSRNAYLSADERRAAGNLSRALRAIADGLAQGQVDIEKLLTQAAQLLPPLRPDYLGVVRPDEFQRLKIAPPNSDLLAVGAAFAGNTRLIDNIQVQTP